jgi:antitoxin component YwqK of YwqJK toxin-antitoxin module
MHLTAAILKRLRACEKQVKLFARVYPNGITWNSPAELQSKMEEAARKGFRVLWAAEKLKLTGFVYGYFPNGDLQFAVRVKKGKRDGRMDQFYRHSTMINITAYYRNGLLHGSYFEYDRTGKVKMKQEYVNGKLVSRQANETEQTKEK